MEVITYSRVSDYLLPDIRLSDPPDAPPIGRYGRMRREFLREHRSIKYSALLLSEQLFPHLRKVEEMANNRLEKIMSNILVFQPPPDKAADGVAWAEHMAEVRRTAEKMMLDEIVYT